MLLQSEYFARSIFSQINIYCFKLKKARTNLHISSRLVFVPPYRFQPKLVQHILVNFIKFIQMRNINLQYPFLKALIYNVVQI